MSRIPKIGMSSGSKVSKENKISSSREDNYGKRPSDDKLCPTEKRQRTNFVSSLEKQTSKQTMRKQTSSSSMPPPALQKVNVKIDLKPKRVALQPIPDTGLVRSSMPAVTSTGKIKFPTKRPGWDLKGRLQDMEEYFHHQLETYNQRINLLETTNTDLHKDVEIKSALSEEATTQIQNLEKEIKEKNEEIKRLEEKITNLQNSYQEEIKAIHAQYKEQINALTCMNSRIQIQLDSTQMNLENQRREVQNFMALCNEKDVKIESLLQEISSMEAKSREEESIRRKLHNTIQELKGNIRVFCRLRPPLPDEEKNGMNAASIVAVSDKTIEIRQLPDVGSNENNGKMQQKYEFSFDIFFPPYASQETVFSEISQLVQSALDGYNVCIFAYGQTGSGKTFTMEGPPDIEDFSADKNHPNLGMIPRSVEQIFSTVLDLEPKGWKYNIQTLFLEIYNERIQDLLNPQCASTKCEIKKSGSNGNDCIISNVTAVDVSSAEQVYKLMKKARQTRMVAATKCNEHSSRSHFVFQMKIHGENSLTSEKCDATLNLVDLAGSERVKDSESLGDRLTEAKSINKSLSTLGKVIMSLSKKDSHIPYRDSKLTHLLANSLGGNSKTLMFVNISPDNKNLGETLNSLRFATKVNQCVIGTAQKKIKL